jgi:hypothetical protein
MQPTTSKETLVDLQTICGSVIQGKTVHWSNENYVVIRDDIGQWMIQCVKNGHCIGLTWSDGSTLNGKEDDFYVAVTPEERLQQLTSFAKQLEALATQMWQRRSNGMDMGEMISQLDNLAFVMSELLGTKNDKDHGKEETENATE